MKKKFIWVLLLLSTAGVALCFADTTLSTIFPQKTKTLTVKDPVSNTALNIDSITGKNGGLYLQQNGITNLGIWEDNTNTQSNGDGSILNIYQYRTWGGGGTRMPNWWNARPIMRINDSNNNGFIGIGRVYPFTGNVCTPIDAKQQLDVCGTIRFGAQTSGLPSRDPGGLLYALSTNTGSGIGNEAVLTVSDGAGSANDMVWIGPNVTTPAGTVKLVADTITLNSSSGSGTNIYMYATNFKFIGTSFINSTGYWTVSDIKLKKDVRTIPDALQRVCKLRGVNFVWKDKKKDLRTHMGLIAQEVENIFPELVDEFDGEKAVDYTGSIGALVESIKALKKENDELNHRVALLEEKLNKK